MLNVVGTDSARVRIVWICQSVKCRFDEKILQGWEMLTSRWRPTLIPADASEINSLLSTQ